MDPLNSGRSLVCRLAGGQFGGSLLLNHDCITPLYEQIAQQIKQEVNSGCFDAQKRLPTEKAFAEQFKVSRITVRKAIQLLSQEGLVETKQGKGTFVRPQAMRKNLKRPCTSFTENCIENGMIPHSKLLRAGIVKVSEPRVANGLNIPIGSKAVQIMRLRCANDKPCVIEDNHFPLEFAYLLNMDLENDSLYRILREEKKLNIIAGELVLRITKADSKVAKLLQVENGAPLLSMFGRTFHGDGEILHTCSQIGYGENFDFIIR